MRREPRVWGRGAALALASALCFVCPRAGQQGPAQGGEAKGASLEETRQTMGKWLEIQQIISKERKDWQQGKEILLGRLTLLDQEATTLKGKIQEAESGVAQANAKKEELLSENEQLKTALTQLTEAVTGMESEVRRLYPSIPEVIRAKVEPLFQRIPENPADTRASAAERFQNVLGILNEINKANNEITVNYEVRELSGGKPAEVQAIYVGLAQAYYVSAGGEAGIGRPSAEGWTWEPAPTVAPDVLRALEILQGKQTPAFVPLPVKLQ